MEHFPILTVVASNSLSGAKVITRESQAKQSKQACFVSLCVCVFSCVFACSCACVCVFRGVKMEENRCKVVVVGGGLAGLAAARMLSGYRGLEDVVVLEADSSLGGRIKHITGLAPWPVEVGPEFLHGRKHSSVRRIAEEMGCQIREFAYPDRYYLGHEGRMVSSSEADEHTDILHVHQIFARLAEEDPDVPDMSMAEYLHCKGVNHVVTQLAQSFYANDFGCSLEQLGLRECIEEAQQWIYGDTYLILDRPLSSIIDYLSQGLQVHLNWPVVRVEYTEDKGVRLWSQDGSTICADYLILTVPMKILQECIVEFDPPLPPSKLKSIQSIGMQNALKVIMAFSESFWPEDLFDVICTDCFLPEIWVTQYPDVANEAAKRTALGQFVVVGFMAGELAVAASQLSDGDILRQALSQLDSMFGTKNGSTTLNAEPCSKPSCTFQDTTDTMNSNSQVLEPDGEMMDPFPGVAEMPHKLITRSELHHWEMASWDWKLKPASTSFQGGYVMNWELQEYVRGGYTHPSLHAHGARSTLAEPLSGRVFFAGEATHPGVNPCLQAAFDTGQRAASEIIALALANPSRL